MSTNLNGSYRAHSVKEPARIDGRQRSMKQTPEEYMRMLIDRVKNDKVEVHMEFTPENTIIEIQPWEPIEMSCTYGRKVKNDE